MHDSGCWKPLGFLIHLLFVLDTYYANRGSYDDMIFYGTQFRHEHASWWGSSQQPQRKHPPSPKELNAPQFPEMRKRSCRRAKLAVQSYPGVQTVMFSWHEGQL